MKRKESFIKIETLRGQKQSNAPNKPQFLIQRMLIPTTRAKLASALALTSLNNKFLLLWG
jgi:hypothetical protein